MSGTYTLIYDTLEENGISAGAEFLKWPVEKLHHDAFTLGLIPDEEGNCDMSKNHCEESRKNERTNERGVLVIKLLSYIDKSTSVVFRKTYTFKQVVTVGDFLHQTMLLGWNKYKMLTTPEGAKKGCRHHLKFTTMGCIGLGWINDKTDDGLKMDGYLPYVYTMNDDLDEDDPDYLMKVFKPIEEGELL